MKKKYQNLDLIERHRVLLWSRIRDKLIHHLKSIESKLEPYDLESIVADDTSNTRQGPSLKELDSFFEKMDQSTK